MNPFKKDDGGSDGVNEEKRTTDNRATDNRVQNTDVQASQAPKIKELGLMT